MPHHQMLIKIIFCCSDIRLTIITKENIININRKNHNYPTCYLLHHNKICCARSKEISTKKVVEFDKPSTWTLLWPL